MNITILQYILNGHLIPTLAMIILLVFVCLNPLFVRKQTRLFIIAISAIIVAIIAVSIDTYLSLSRNALGSATYVVRRITSFLNFSLSPIIPFILYLIFANEKKSNMLYAIPMFLNAFICFFSIFFKIVFFITPSNTYDRGVLFLLPFATSIFYIIMVLIKRTDFKNNLKTLERLYLISSIVLLIVGMIMEIALYYRFIVWSITALIFVLYYLFLNINARLVDPLTGIYNRAMYEKSIEVINKKKACIVAIFDINGFKSINDTYGHARGDKYLINFALLLRKFLGSIASVYRIGGDEFFCICKKVGLARFNEAIVGLKADCQMQNISFAFGALQYNIDDDVAETLESVDELMYRDKQEYKNAMIKEELTSNII